MSSAPVNYYLDIKIPLMSECDSSPELVKRRCDLYRMSTRRDCFACRRGRCCSSRNVTIPCSPCHLLYINYYLDIKIPLVSGCDSSPELVNRRCGLYRMSTRSDCSACRRGRSCSSRSATISCSPSITDLSFWRLLCERNILKCLYVYVQIVFS